MSETLPDEPISVLHKHPKRRGFVQVENSTVRDPRLSFKATGLLVYLISLPQGSPIGSRVLAERKSDGRSAIMSAFRELRELGYVDQRSHRRDDGTFTTTTHVFEVPPGSETAPGFGLPGSDKPVPGNRPISLSESKTNDENEPISRISCSACGENFVSMDDVQDHQEQTCEKLHAEEDFGDARAALKKSGGRGLRAV